MRKEKEADHGPRPCKEKREFWFGCPYVGNAVAEVVRRCRVPNTHACSAPKRVAVRVNGGLVRRGHRRESVGASRRMK